MSHDARPRYSSPVTPLNGLEPITDDVDMAESPEVQTTTLPIVQSVGPSKVSQQYLAIDTNILLNHLRLVKALRVSLDILEIDESVRLLVPSTVINELDGLGNSEAVAGSSPAGPVKVADLARAATSWLLKECKASKNTGRVRCQKWAEKLNDQLRKPDDKILDCCLYFAQQCRVLLWTNDQNLSLLAETNDVSTVGGHDVTLFRLLRALNIEVSPLKADTIRRLEDGARAEPIIANPETSEDFAGDMNIDIDLLLKEMPYDQLNGSTMHTLGLADIPRTPGSRRSSNAGSARNRSSSSSPTKNQSTPYSLFDEPPDRPTKPLILPGHYARLLTPQLDLAFKTAFSPFAKIATRTTTFSMTTTTTTTSHSTLRLVNDLLDQLTTLDEALPPLSQSSRPDDHRLLIRCISATRDVLHFLTPAKFARKPRIGEVSDALECLGDELPIVLGIGGREDLYGLAEQVRRLPS